MLRYSVMNAGQRRSRTPINAIQVVRVRVTPRGGRDALSGWQDGVLRVRLAAPPVDGRANESLIRFLAQIVGVPSGAVGLVGGDHSRTKRIAFDGVEPAVLRERLGVPPEVMLG
jgi:uncharacterized protein (TIGR00251 family)